MPSDGGVKSEPQIDCNSNVYKLSCYSIGLTKNCLAHNNLCKACSDNRDRIHFPWHEATRGIVTPPPPLDGLLVHRK